MREAWQVSSGAQKLQSGMHHRRCGLGRTLPSLSVLLAGLKERRQRKGGPWMPKMNRGNEYICKGKTQTVLKVLMHRPYISILMHKHSVFMKLETKLRDWLLFRLKCELQFMYNIVSCTFYWYLLLSIKGSTLELQRLLVSLALFTKMSWCYGKGEKLCTLNFIRRVSESIVKCCSVEIPWSAVYYKFFCLPKQLFIYLFIYLFTFFFFSRSVHFFLKKIQETRK